ncbi:hypothetical protein ACFLTR_04535 [Chloroflexota bacterium]
MSEIFVMLVALLVVAAICLGLIAGTLIVEQRWRRIEQLDITK